MKVKLFLSLLVLAFTGALLCCKTGAISEENTDMNSMVSVLKKENIDHFVFSNAQGNSLLVVPRFGARILAVSVSGENLFWTHPDILKGQGGQRSWVSPEGGAKGFIFRPDWNGNRDFSMLDPGRYTVSAYKENEHIVLENTFRAASNDGQEAYDLTLTREVRLKKDPLEDDPEFKGLDYDYLGIDFVHHLRNNSRDTLDRILGLWCLIQIPPKGTMIVPVQDVRREAWRDTYFEPIPREFVKANPGSFSFSIHGSQRYKVGVRPESARGVIGYLSRAANGAHFMAFMTFPVRPDARYTDRPKTEQETNGDAIQLYSHLEKGALAFGELECQSWGLNLGPGSEEDFPIQIYLYKASLDTLQKIGSRLVCSEFDRAHLFEIE